MMTFTVPCDCSPYGELDVHQVSSTFLTFIHLCLGNIFVLSCICNSEMFLLMFVTYDQPTQASDLLFLSKKYLQMHLPVIAGTGWRWWWQPRVLAWRQLASVWIHTSLMGFLPPWMLSFRILTPSLWKTVISRFLLPGMPYPSYLWNTHYKTI